jgi:molybdopterin-biosynthesis enzyme MoeA-like protein
MGGQTFGISKRRRCWTDNVDGMSVERNETGPFHEVEHRQTRRKARTPSGGQYMIWPRDIIANCLWRHPAQENRPGMPDEIKQAFSAVIVHSQFKMLGRKAVYQRHRTFQIIDNDNSTEISPTLSRNCAR